MDGDDEKENRPGSAASARGGIPGTGRARKGGSGHSLRKSLAWNNAFFTEEGVLNTSELSALSGSVSKAGGSFLSGIDEEIATPFTSKVLGRGKMELHPIEEASARRPLPRTENNGRTFGGTLSGLSHSAQRGTLSGLNHSAQREPLAHLTFGKLQVSKAPGKSILQPPKENSQKRLANTCTVNPASKIPRLKGTKSSSLPTAPRSNIQPVKESKCIVLSDKLPPKSSRTSAKMRLTAAKPSVKARIDGMIDKKSVPCSSSNLQKLQDGRDTHNSSLLHGASPPICLPVLNGQDGPRSPLSTQITASNSQDGSKNILPSCSQDSGSSVHFQVPCSSIQRLAKPSALRMPSPSLGFFLPGKVSSTNVLNSDRDGLLSLNSESKVQSLRKPNAERHVGGKTVLHGSHEQPHSVIAIEAGSTKDSSFEQASICDLKDNDTFLSSDMDNNNCITHCSMKDGATFTECKVGTTINTSGSENILKEGSIPLKNLLKAEPFTDEWIGAVEAFGEGILKVKSGTVQNSPPEKSLPEPNPWSPIKKKHHDLGPYDCTKYSKATSN